MTRKYEAIDLSTRVESYRNETTPPPPLSTSIPGGLHRALASGVRGCALSTFASNTASNEKERRSHLRLSTRARHPQLSSLSNTCLVQNLWFIRDLWTQHTYLGADGGTSMTTLCKRLYGLSIHVAFIHIRRDVGGG